MAPQPVAIPYNRGLCRPISARSTAMTTAETRTATLLVHCRDQRGLVADVSDFIARNEGNIVYFDQHVDDSQGVFFMRVEWALPGFRLDPEEIGPAFEQDLAHRYAMAWRLHFSDHVPRMAIFVSRLPHCLYDLLSRWQSGEWRVEIPLIVSNHEHLRPVAEQFGVPFHCFPITPENKAQQEERELALLRDHDIELVVLARYMQVLSPRLIDAYRERLINIHHSFRRATVPCRPRPRREDHRRHQPLRDRRTGRRADHRAGRRSHHPPR